MKKLKLFIPLILATLWQPTALALEGPAVKATTVLKTQSSWDGKPIEYPSGTAEVTGMIIEIAPGLATGWHSHPVPSFALVLEGEIEVQQKNGDIKRLKSGDALAEVVDTFHNGRNVGSVPVKLVVFYVGAAGQKLTVKKDGQ